ncbi:SDR family NAD(P)-dependent oxidoreductase [Chitinophaga nivalis]|uniref:SDR family NAD(P)-dependent oxidoreductase n=1 Tax=Chitinophaga nivalis TaxID=2991709 RepID=A0ABT3IIW9_9BACT|nr:SDR family NAD(P)-dependent oxidoreductase [Chitinophaga nivalis]MCW3466421.1 SDR family NAD(P)-dependent oxidoreductase [Chitinophaga nivalis]MCW3483888.1 SDR family NAD(P)-dependent oxidoreductase [Chitinophaga nivalis]
MITEQILLSLKNPMLAHHKAYGQELLPGLAYIDLLFQIFRKRGYAFNELELCNLSIHHPMTLEGVESIQLQFVCTPDNDHQWQVKVEAVPVAQQPAKTYVTALMKRVAPIVFNETMDVAVMKKQAAAVVDIEEIYARSRSQELIHTGLMKADGYIYKTADFVCVDLSVPREALPSADSFMFHPTLIDASGVGSAELMAALVEEEQRLFLPLFYESFRAADLFNKTCITRVQKSSIRKKNELLYMTMEFFDQAGKKIGELRNFTNKLVRGAALINRGRKENPTPAAAGRKVVAPAVTVTATATAEKGYAASEALITQFIAARLKTDPDDIATDIGYYEMGLDSPGLLEIVRLIEKEKQITLAPTLLFEYTTVQELATYLATQYPDKFEGTVSAASSAGTVTASGSAGEKGYAASEALITQFIAARLKTDPDDIATDIGYYEMGLDSPGLLEIVRLIEKEKQITLAPTLLFEYTTVQELAAYLATQYPDKFEGTVSAVSPVATVAAPAVPAATARQADGDMEIAVIGLSGRYPGADNIAAFWQNLVDGKDCITEVPAERWDWQQFAQISSPSGKKISRWGGFINHADCFDPQFFRISPREAEIMDPQERVFLEVCWEALEDAGYTPDTLVAQRGMDKRQAVGVFVGVMHKDYTLIAAEAVAKGLVFPLSLNYAPIANRVSYFCNFHGPSIAVDTVCSSSLTGLHLAIESIRRGECEAALAGGVNLSLHPNKYLTYGIADMHSSDGYCHTFGKDGDGYVSGEGVGAVLLKPLHKAVQDKDHIYAVIKGSTINHVGTGSGIMVPSPVAQADMITQCMEKTGIHPRTISYVEAHGTGTSLGDPIEIQGLVKSYGQYTQDKQYCAIGSVKSNIGHAESAAGISGLSKVILQLYHKTLVPSLHSAEVNPHLQLTQSPFYIQQDTRPWERPTILEQGQAVTYPRRASVSSFGATGSNAYVILEEYIPAATAEQPALSRETPYLIPLSAKTKEQVRVYAEQLLAFLRGQQAADTEVTDSTADLLITQLSQVIDQQLSAIIAVPENAIEPDQEWTEYGVETIHLTKLKEQLQQLLGAEMSQVSLSPATTTIALAQQLIQLERSRITAFLQGATTDNVRTPVAIHTPQSAVHIRDVAYTLQAGREAMEERLLLITDSIPALIVQLQSFLAGKEQPGQCFAGRIKKAKELSKYIGTAEKPAAVTQRFIQEQQWEQLATLWMYGAAVNWNSLYPAVQPARISLPTYPFVRERYWIPEVEQMNDAIRIPQQVLQQYLHPLLHTNTSTFTTQRYTAHYTGAEFFFRDHMVQGQPVLPGTAYLELAHAAMAASLDEASGKDVICTLQHVAWIQPYVLNSEHPAPLHITLLPATAGWVNFEVYSDAATGKLVHCQGAAKWQQVAAAPVLDVAGIRSGSIEILHATALYGLFEQMGIQYGAAHRGVQRVYKKEGALLGELSLPVVDAGYVLHPGLADAGLQAAIGLVSADGTGQTARSPLLPFSVDQVQIYGATGPAMWTYIRFSDTAVAGMQKLDITWCDDNGNICTILKGFTSRAADRPSRSEGILQLQPVWVPQPAVATGADSGRLVVYCGDTAAGEQLRIQLGGISFLPLPVAATDLAANFTHHVFTLFEKIQSFISGTQKSAVLIQLVTGTTGINRIYGALAGLLKTAQQESPHIRWQLLEVPATLPAAAVAAVIETNRYAVNQYIRYAADERMVLRWEEQPGTPVAQLPWKENGVYLITGGAGGLGRIFAQTILAQAPGARVILVGRSAVPAASLREIGDEGRLIYKQKDISQRDAVAELFREIRATHGQLQGILHSAGVIRDNFLIRKTTAEITAVLSAKVAGTVYLDEYSRDFTLDHFILFSSVAGALGNAGQGDYAVANAFLDQYASYRNELVARGERTGRSISLNWPLWQSGGMHVDAATAQLMQDNIGMYPLQTAQGIQSFYEMWGSGQQQLLVMAGDTVKLRRLWQQVNPETAVVAPAIVETTTDISQEITPEKAAGYFKKLLSGVLKLPAHKIEADTAFEQFGIDSVMVIQLTNELEKVFGTLSKTLLFEYQTVEDLTGYFVAGYPEKMRALLGVHTPPAVLPAATAAPVTPLPAYANRLTAQQQPVAAPQEDGEPAIAIIGLAGKYPQADNIIEFWQHLKSGKDCITEVPRERWDHSQFYDADKTKPGKTYSKWGGFINGVDEFDPLFFNISPREAEIMDPQERLFLQCAIATLEDAGYTRELLSQYKANGMEGNVGVFAGVMYTEYQLYGAQETALGRPLAIPGNPSSIANRVSYYCNFHGPSMAVDTMCSSSLTAIHLACQSIQRGDCELALAGGVNVSVHPNKYLMLGQGRFVSSKGRCESFGEGGDGYVPGEGVGAVLLKPLHKAIADGDHIYGVIRSSVVNHGGKTNGYSVPNPQAQANVIKRAFRKSGIDPATISYIEAHGTGTSLGDPIEITGLKKAFETFTAEREFCAIGSAKSNIGHCESAAGIAGLTKILLQMQHQQLVPSLHSAQLNVHIDFRNSPFVVQQHLSAWQRPVREKNGIREEVPLRAGLSSFGAGGSNAHLVIEEYQVPAAVAAAAGAPCMLVFSARTTEQLKAVIQQFITYLQAAPAAPFAHIAYTLQTGREGMEERMGILATDAAAAIDQLTAYLAGGSTGYELYQGNITLHKGSLSLLMDEDFQQAVANCIRKGKYDRLLELWVKGYNIDWAQLYPVADRKKVSLPTYPFARERYWAVATQQPATVTPVAQTYLHPLLHTNTSTFIAQRYTAHYTGTEFFFRDHIVQGQPVLPGTAYLELARAAMQASSEEIAPGTAICVLKHVVWIQPYIFNHEHPAPLHITLTPTADSEVAFEIYSDTATGRLLHCQGAAEWQQVAAPPVLDVAAIRLNSDEILNGPALYEWFGQIGIQYGAAHRGVQGICKNGTAVLGQLALPAMDAGYVLHPGLADAGLQAAIGLVFADREGQAATRGPLLPFSVDEVQIYGATQPAMWTYIRSRDTATAGLQKLDITWCDDNGNVCAVLKGFTSRSADLQAGSTRVLQLQPVWVPQPAGLAGTDTHRLVVYCGSTTDGEQLRTQLPGVSFLQLSINATDVAVDFNNHVFTLFNTVQPFLSGAQQSTILIQLVAGATGVNRIYGALAGLLKTAQQEAPHISWQLLELPATLPVAAVAAAIETNRYALNQHIRYEKEERKVLCWEEWTHTPVRELPWKENGVYLITGGAGGLGRIFAQTILEQAPGARVILVGRSAVSTASLREIGSEDRLVYKQADISQRDAVATLFREIRATYGQLHGVLHSAGVIRDNFLIRKTAAEITAVLSAKVAGTVYLDEYSRDFTLDHFILFSSVAGALGNAGQGDYAVANAFLDQYASYRNELVARGERTGRSISLNWPLWESGGMHVDAATAQLMQDNIGMYPLQTAEGIQAFYDMWGSGQAQLLVMAGDTAKLRRLWQQINPATAIVEDIVAAVPVVTNTELSQEVLSEKATAYFKKLLSGVLKLPAHKIDDHKAFEQFGVDSVMVIQLTNELEKTFGALSKTLLFEYQTIDKLTKYFISQYAAPLAAAVGVKQTVVNVPAALPQPVAAAPLKLQEARFRTKPAAIPAAEAVAKAPEKTVPADIAIIAMAGQYPQADNLTAFWNNLQAGKDCITEVPETRWNHALYYDADRTKQGKAYSKWGGFINGVEVFDPLFFNISPREAMLIDPQERLFMQQVWTLLESGGYTRSRLQQQHQGRVGVYVGTMYKQYNTAVPGSVEDAVLSLSSYNSIANRVSYYFNLQGPSLAIDTACSSSLIAIHMACESLLKAECEVAIAGGVNLSLDPRKYVGLSQLQLIGSSADSRSFAAGDGYLPAEAIGAVLLKPLEKALRDGDTVLAVIKSTMTNHNGKSNSFAVPNLHAQTQLMTSNFVRSGIEPASISWVEAAANGNPIGDAIEMKALSNVFRQFKVPAQGCPVGSVKSHIGHAEAASGISQLTKVVLQLQHQQLIPVVANESRNSQIDLQDSPLYIQEQLTRWERPVVEIAGVKQEFPRRATVSSFGAGGSNAHIILEEYTAPVTQPVQPDTATSYLMVFSAKNDNRLQAVLSNMLQYLQEHPAVVLADLAYTLQAGREAMECRVALVVASLEELQTGLAGALLALTDNTVITGDIPLFLGNAEAALAGVSSLLSGKTGEQFCQHLLQERNLEKLAIYWTQFAGEVDWQQLYLPHTVRFINLPAYPFEQRRCWIENNHVPPVVIRETVAAPVNTAKKTIAAEGSADNILVGIIADMLRLQPAELNTKKPLQHYGLDSIQVMELFQRIKSTIYPDLSLEALQQCNTTDDIIRILPVLSVQHENTALLPEAAADMVVKTHWPQFPELFHLNDKKEGKPVFWIHAALGGVQSYKPLAEMSERPFFGIQARGWMSNRFPLVGLQAMATYYVQIIQTVQPEGPYDIGGYSMGGILAYEITRQLQDLGQTVDSVTMLDAIYREDLKRGKVDRKTSILQAVNLSLLTKITQQPEKFKEVLIHRDEVDIELEEEPFLQSLITIAKTRGLTRTEEQLKTLIAQNVKVQQAYEIDKYVVHPLPYPAETTCYYFRNKSGLFYGDLEPFYKIKATEFTLDHKNYWEEWEKQLPNLYMMDVDASNHMMLLSEEKVYRTIFEFCRNIYSRQGMDPAFMPQFVADTLRIHGEKDLSLLTESVGV